MFDKDSYYTVNDNILNDKHKYNTNYDIIKDKLLKYFHPILQKKIIYTINDILNRECEKLFSTIDEKLLSKDIKNKYNEFKNKLNEKNYIMHSNIEYGFLSDDNIVILFIIDVFHQLLKYIDRYSIYFSSFDIFYGINRTLNDIIENKYKNYNNYANIIINILNINENYYIQYCNEKNQYIIYLFDQDKNEYLDIELKYNQIEESNLNLNFQKINSVEKFDNFNKDDDIIKLLLKSDNKEKYNNKHQKNDKNNILLDYKNYQNDIIKNDEKNISSNGVFEHKKNDNIHLSKKNMENQSNIVENKNNIIIEGLDIINSGSKVKNNILNKNTKSDIEIITPMFLKDIETPCVVNIDDNLENDVKDFYNNMLEHFDDIFENKILITDDYQYIQDISMIPSINKFIYSRIRDDYLHIGYFIKEYISKIRNRNNHLVLVLLKNKNNLKNELKSMINITRRENVSFIFNSIKNDDITNIKLFHKYVFYSPRTIKDTYQNHGLYTQLSKINDNQIIINIPTKYNYWTEYKRYFYIPLFKDYKLSNFIKYSYLYEDLVDIESYIYF